MLPTYYAISYFAINRGLSLSHLPVLSVTSFVVSWHFSCFCTGHFGIGCNFSKFLEFFIYPVYGHVPSPLPQMASTAEVGLGSVSEAPRMHCTKQLQACATGLPHLDKLLTHDYCIKPTLK